MLLQQPSPGKPVSEMGTVLSALLKKLKLNGSMKTYKTF